MTGPIDFFIVTEAPTTVRTIAFRFQIFTVADSCSQLTGKRRLTGCSLSKLMTFSG
jgi:hypothetical protein